MLFLLRFLVGMLNAIGLITVIWYPIANILASTTSRTEALGAIILYIFMYSAFAIMAAYAFSAKLRISRNYWTTGILVNLTCLVLFFFVAAYARLTSSIEAQAGAAEFVRMLIPIVAVLTLNVFLLINNAKKVAADTGENRND